MKEVFAECGEDCYIELPFRANWGGANVHFGNNVWIGDNTVIGAGSVVTKDIPADCVAVGNPCYVIREIGDRDREYFYKNETIDWENL